MDKERVERRAYPRLRVHVRGLEVEIGPPGATPIRGVVLNISRAGLKVKLCREIPEQLLGEDYLVSFIEVRGRISPAVTWARMNRPEPNRQYAIEFEDPLEILEIEDASA